MKTLFTLAVTVLTSVGTFANNDSKNIMNLSQSKNNALETILESNSIIADEVTLIAIDCGNGNLYYVHCHYCSPETIAEILKEACR